jgi:hypothetical protein
VREGANGVYLCSVSVKRNNPNTVRTRRRDENCRGSGTPSFALGFQGYLQFENLIDQWPGITNKS